MKERYAVYVEPATRLRRVVPEGGTYLSTWVLLCDDQTASQANYIAKEPGWWDVHLFLPTGTLIPTLTDRPEGPDWIRVLHDLTPEEIKPYREAYVNHNRMFSPAPRADTPKVVPSDETILQEAQRLVHGDRGADYGHPIDDYTRTGKLWGAILGVPPIDPRTCCLMMAAMKISREVNKHKRDNLTDLAGYAECADMIAQRQEEA